MRVIFSGGGTLGSVVPLLAVAEELRKLDSETEFLWIGTKKGPEKKLVEENQIPFKSIAAGKWRRYFSLENIIDLFKLDIGFLQSFFILRKFLRHPPRRATRAKTVFVSAGGFVSVPTAVASALLRVPILIHQQDVVPGLANKLMFSLAKKITVSLDVSLKDFPKAEVVGNPVRSFIFEGDADNIKEKLNLRDDMPVLLVMGGGTGAKAINELVVAVLPELTKFCQIIHLTGKGKVSHIKTPSADQKDVRRPGLPGRPGLDTKIKNWSTLGVETNYHPIEFTTKKMPDLYAVADLIVSRAGMSSLSEICALGKPSIIIPIPKSHQEKNAEYLAEKGAVKLFNQPPISSPCSRSEIGGVRGGSFEDNFINLTKDLLFNQSERDKFSENAKKIMPPDSARKIAELVRGLTINR